MARVFLVSHTRVAGKQFALKLISQPSVSTSFLQRFKREADVLGRLSHAHIVNIIDYNQTPEGLPYLVMELLDGEDLAHFLQRTGALQKDIALGILYQIGQALQAAHDAGVIHRDLKPGNLFVCRNNAFPNYIKILDFGIAKINTDNRLTADRSLMGTPAYMSPEQARGLNAEIDHRSDQFSLAVILYEMLTGKTPFCFDHDVEPLAVLAQIVSAEPVPLPFTDIWPALARALSKNPADRFPTVMAFVEATGARRAFGAIAKPPSLATNTNGEVSRSHVRWRLASVVGAVSLLACGGLVAWIYTRPKPIIGDSVQVKPPVERVQELDKGQPWPNAGANSPPQQQVTTTDEEPPRQPAPQAKSSALREEEKVTPPTKAKATVKQNNSSSAASAEHDSQINGNSASAFSISVNGANGEQAESIRGCAHKELRDLPGMPKSYKIILARSGTLHITDAPPQVYHTDLAACLRNKLKGKPVPESVTLTVRTAR